MPTENTATKTTHVVRCTVVGADSNNSGHVTTAGSVSHVTAGSVGHVTAGGSNSNGGGATAINNNQLLKPKYQNLTKISLGEDTYTIGMYFRPLFGF